MSEKILSFSNPHKFRQYLYIFTLILFCSIVIISLILKITTVRASEITTNRSLSTNKSPSLINHTSIIDQSPYPTPTPTFDQSLFKTTIDNIAKTMGTVIGTVIAMVITLVFIGIIWFLVFIVKKDQVDMTIDGLEYIDGSWVEEPSLIVEIQKAFLNLKHQVLSDLSSLQGRIDFRGELPIFFTRIDKQYLEFDKLTKAAGMDLGSILNKGGTNYDDISYSVSVGPMDIKGSRIPLINRLLKRRKFQLTVNKIPPIEEKMGRIIFVLTLENETWYSKSYNYKYIDSNEIDDIVRKVVTEIAWVSSRKSRKEAEQINYETPSEVLLLNGIRNLIAFMHNPRTSNTLAEAQKIFHDVENQDNEWGFQAKLLRAISSLLTKRQPKQTAKLFTEIQKTYREDQSKKTILAYFVGQAQFYTYSKEGYQKAITNFEIIKRPLPNIWKISKSVWWIIFSSKLQSVIQKYILFLLAQSNISIVLVHMISKEEDGKIKRILERKVSEINNVIEEEVNKANNVIEFARSDILWRINNAKIMLSLTLHEKFEEGQEAAKQALSLAPYALDVKANLGSLYMQEAARKISRGYSVIDTEEVEKASDIFTELIELDWDIAFNKYRLGTLRRVQGKFEESLELLFDAKKPGTNVPIDHIEMQIKKTENKDTTISEDEIY